MTLGSPCLSWIPLCPLWGSRIRAFFPAWSRTLPAWGAPALCCAPSSVLSSTHLDGGGPYSEPPAGTLSLQGLRRRAPSPPSCGLGPLSSLLDCAPPSLWTPGEGEAEQRESPHSLSLTCTGILVSGVPSPSPPPPPCGETETEEGAVSCRLVGPHPGVMAPLPRTLHGPLGS